MSVIRWRYRRRRLWVMPTVIVAGAVFLSWLFPYLDQEFAAEWAKEFDGPPWEFDAGPTSSVLSAVASGTIAFTGFVFTVVLLSVQLGTSAFSARLIPLFAALITFTNPTNATMGDLGLGGVTITDDDP